MNSLISRLKPQQLVWVVFFSFLILQSWPMLFGKTLVFGDNYSLMVPGKIFTARWLRQGVIPLWNPTIMSGIPWVDDTNQSVLYPLTLLFAVLQPVVAFNLTVIFHFGLAGAGMYFWARRWTSDRWLAMAAGLGWMLSTQVAGNANNVSTLQAVAWLPWLGYWGEAIVPATGSEGGVAKIGELGINRNKPKLWFIAVTIVQLLAGYPQYSVYSVVTAVLFSAYRWYEVVGARQWQAWWRWLATWIEVGFWVIGVGSFVWLPLVERLAESTRTLQTNAQAAGGSLNPVMMMKVVLPYFFDQPIAGMKWGPAWSGHPNMVWYLGWVGLAALVSVSGRLIRKFQGMRSDGFFLGLVIVTMLIALGSYLPGFELLQTVVPWFRVGRGPSIILIVTTVALLLWLVTIWPRVVWPKWGWQTTKVGAGSLVAIGLVSWMVVLTSFPNVWHGADRLIGGRLSGGAFHTLERDRVIAQVIAQDLTITALLAVASLVALRHRRWSILAVLFGLDLWFHTQAIYFWAPSSVYPTWSELSQPPSWMQQANIATTGRWLTRNSNRPYTDFNAYWEAMVVRAPFSDSFVDEAELKTLAHARALRDGLTPDWNMPWNMPMANGYITLMPQDYARLWPDPTGVARINFLPEFDLADPVTQKLLSDWAVDRYVVDTWFTITEPLPTTPPLLTTERWQIYQLPSLGRFRFDDGQGQEVRVEPTIESESPNKIVFQVNNVSGQPLLRMADRFDKYWTANVNGQPVPITADRGMRVIPIQPGVNQVVFEYQPLSLYLGGALSLFLSSLLLLRLTWLTRFGFGTVGSR